MLRSLLRFRMCLLGFSLAWGIAAPPAVRAQYVSAGGEFSAQVVPAMNGVAADFSPHRAGLAAQADLKIPIGSAGVYRITQPQLVASGMDSNQLIGDQIRLFCRTQEVAIQVSNAGLWTTNDALWFYGAPHPGYYSTTNVYWLGMSGGTRLGMAVLDGATNSGGTLVTTHWDRVSYAPDLLWRDFYRPWDDAIDHWFAALVSHTADVPTAVTVDERIATGSAYLQTLIYGLTSSSHTTRVWLNGTPVLSYAYAGAERFATTDVVTASLLVNGANTFTWRQTNAPLDSIYISEFLVDYQRSLKARNNSLHFNGLAGTNLYQISGFTTNAGFYVLEVSDPAVPVMVTNWTVSGAPGNYMLNFRAVLDTPRRFCVLTDSRMAGVPGLRRCFFRDLASTNNQADYLLITPYDLRRPAYDLLKHRQTNGLAVKAVPLDDLYNEFSYGIEDAAAIKQFIGYAYHHWTAPAPRFVCLVGEGTPDPRNGLGLNPAITLPVHYGPSSFNWCPQDNWYGCVDGTDWLVDLSIGRIPVASTTELARVVAKTKSYESSDLKNEALLVADMIDAEPPPLDFKLASDTCILPFVSNAGYFRSEIYFNGTQDPSLLRSEIALTINAGVDVVTYFGHGAADLWSKSNIWGASSISMLNNQHYPVVLIFSCENGAYDDLWKQSLAESFIRGAYGAVACVAPAGLSVHAYSETLAKGFMREFTNQNTRLGDAMNAGLLNLWGGIDSPTNKSAYELLFYQVFGDPALEKY